MINRKLAFRIIAYYLTLLCLTTGSAAFAQSTFIHHYTTKDGLPSNNCFFTLQDSKGYLWFGTDAGVSRFDGQRFENFSIDDGLPDNQVIQIKEDKKGRIWFIAFNGEMSYFLDGIIYNSTNDKSLQVLKFKAVVISVFQDSKDRLWFGTNKNLLYLFDGKSLTTFKARHQADQFFFTYINEDAQGRIWAYSNNSVKVYENGKFKSSENTPVKPVSYKTITSLPDNSLLYIGKGGLNYHKADNNVVLHQIDAALLNDNLGYFYADQKELWLSHKSGILHVDESGKTHTYLQGTPTVQVIKDSKLNMWFTTSNGIYMLPGRKNRLFVIDKSHGLGSNAVKSITKDKKHNIWLGLDNGNINKLQHLTLKVDQIEIQDKETFNTGIKKLLLDESSQSLHFASDFGLGRLNGIDKNNPTIDYLKETNRSLFVVKDFSIDQDGKLALALSSGVVLLKETKKHFEFNMSHLKNGVNFFNDRAYSVFFDGKGILWFSNYNGLNYFTGHQERTLQLKDQLANKRINDIDELADGTLVVATDGYGLFLIKGNTILYQFTQKEGLASNICKKLYVSNNHVWVVTNNGINRVCLIDGKPMVKSFEYTNALLRNDVNDVFVDADTSYFATNTGLVYFNHTPHQSPNEPLHTLISSVEVNDKKRSLKEQGILLDATRNKISFRFGAIDFQGQDVVFRYRLNPDDQWIETRSRRMETSSLEPGKYTFEVSSRTSNSNWGEPDKFSFELKAKIWQTTWFMLFLFVVAGISFYEIAVMVTRKQKDKEQQKLLLKNKILMLEQKALQAMMNPHFVFNVMNSIQHYINTKDTGSANKVLTGFARLIRKNMEICTKSYISMQEELEYLELYLSLEKKRFGNKLNYEIQVDQRLDREETFIPSMLLQPYIENAIWHGIMPLETGGELKILINLIAPHLLNIEIMDTGIGIENSLKHKKNSHSSKGMSLTQERINLLNEIEANPIQISVKQNGGSGTSVSINIALP
ncbi:ligand-binding sensor domain-containing protein [Pedobacter immunditicola]|uniref:ligand-binding sensor domain-containing protein n=1 Tax=Pedobacter immunditicola TaxID=3133440 RepID=UPI00309840C7